MDYEDDSHMLLRNQSKTLFLILTHFYPDIDYFVIFAHFIRYMHHTRAMKWLVRCQKLNGSLRGAYPIVQRPVAC